MWLCIFLHPELSNNPHHLLLFLPKRMLRQWDRGMECPSVSLFIHSLPFIQSVFAVLMKAHLDSYKEILPFASRVFPAKLSPFQCLKF